MITFFKAKFPDPTTHGVFRNYKMVAKIADFDTKYYINPRKKHSGMNENHKDFVFHYKLTSEV